ncbi:MAG: glycosyltransferase family 39 protein [Anaerolineaceae bacterium]|nr:glycosyltransferase family 39 protein [Anaerolineaceae bacterium]
MTANSRLNQPGLHLTLLFACILLGLFLRLAFVQQWNHTHPDTPTRLVGDEPGYDNTARELLAGYGFTWPGRVPLYPVWLAVVYQVGDGSLNFAGYAQALLGVLVIPLTYTLGRRMLGGLTGLLAALFAAISYVLISQPTVILSENLYVPVLLLAMITLWDAVQKPTRRRVILAGMVLGIANLIRPTLLFFPFAFILLMWFVEDWRKAVRHGLIYLTASIIVVTPWVVHNYARYQAIFALQTSNAILWQGSPEYYHLIRDEGYTYMQVWGDVLYGPGWQEHDPTSVAGDRYWTQRAIDSILSEPITYLRYAAEKVVTFWVGDPNADWNNTFIFNYQALLDIGFPPTSATQYMIALMLPILALLAVFVLREQWRVLLPVFAMLVYFTVLHAATHAEARLSLPLQPFLLILIAGAVVWLFARQSVRQDHSL